MARPGRIPVGSPMRRDDLSYLTLGREQCLRAAGVGTYVLLSRVLQDPWLALPGAFLALVLSAGSRSGVEEGMRWGLVAARLGWGALPILACALHRWTARRAAPIEAAALLAA